MTNNSPKSRYFLGIDTGGTFTDAVLLNEDMQLLAKAKALTSYQDLAVGISEAIDRVLTLAKAKGEEIALVSLSTTLATNALVEGVGARTGLIMIGFSPVDAERAGLREALGTDPVIYCAGGHNGQGKPNPLDLNPVAPWLEADGGPVDGYAIAGCFAVRNAEHELAARDLVEQATGKPVTCSHELSSKLGGPKRALTTVLNARLVPMIARLMDSMETALHSRAIKAPLMIVRGDGALISSRFARSRPIETILSGPAASLFGARHLTGHENAIVSDIGGTTTDVAILEAGTPRIDPQGALVGGHRTMVEAVAMRTFGLGGDSEVSMAETGLDVRLSLGPRRVIPLSQAAARFPDVIIPALNGQIEAPHLPRHAGRFVMRLNVEPTALGGLNARAQKLMGRISDTPQPVEKVILANAERATLDQLVARRMVALIGFTPTDAAHVTGSQKGWSQEAAQLGAELFARRKTGAGKEVADNGAVFSELVLKLTTLRSAEVILETAFGEDGLDGQTTLGQAAIKDAISGASGPIAKISIAFDRPVIGLGASASLHYEGLANHVSCQTDIPNDADVANAIGAIVGHVSIKTIAHIGATAPDQFQISVGDQRISVVGEAEAMARARKEAEKLARERAELAGAEAIECLLEEEIRATENDGQRIFVEATITATARGRPKVA